MVTKTRVAVLLTVLYLGVIAYFRGPDAWCLLRGGELNELGDFLAGLFTPVAFLWLIYGYLLQTKELGLQTEELGLQRQELEKTRETLNTQVEVLKEQATAERRRSMPRLDITRGGYSSGGSQRTTEFYLLNYGGPARNLEIFLRSGIGQESDSKVRSLDTDRDFKLTINELSRVTGSRSYSYTVCFISERHDRFYQRWEIRLDDNDPTIEIEEITKGPSPLMDNERPPCELRMLALNWY